MFQGTGFLGCMSFSLQDLVEKPSAEMPRWWWLLSKRQGLARNESVEHEVIRGEAAREPDLIVSGRSESLPNSLVISLAPLFFRFSYNNDHFILVAQ